MKQIGVGLLGFGTVGAGVVDGLQKRRELLAQRIGADIVLRRIADVDLERDRGVTVDRALLTADARAVITAPSVDIVVELIGGTGIARTLVMEALQAGKSVVTANKKLLAEYGEEIFSLAEESGVDLYFGASVGGGIPIVRVLREGLVGNAVTSMYGILNGTCNYILTRMEHEGLPFGEALAAAQAAGYAEANPSLDIDGFDTAHKAVILASLAYGFHVPMSVAAVEGIRGLAGIDVQFARAHAFVAARQTARADDALGLEAFDGFIQRPGAAGNMRAIGAGAGGELRVAVDQQGRAVVLRQRGQRAQDRLALAGVARGEADKHAGDVAGAERGRQRLVEGLGAFERRGDEIEAGRRGLGVARHRSFLVNRHLYSYANSAKARKYCFLAQARQINSRRRSR